MRSPRSTRESARVPTGVAWLVANMLLVSVTGCAPTQMIGLAVSPEPVVLFVDGDRVDGLPESVELTANKDHTLFFQREGYRSQLIIVRTAEREDGEDYLSPERIEVTLKRAATTAPGITVELEEPEGEVRNP